MILEINKLIESDIDEVSEIGWLLYHEDLEKGLSPEVTRTIVEKLSNGIAAVCEEYLYTERDLDKSYDSGYDDGFGEAKSMYSEY